MSQLETPEDVPALEHERDAVVPSPDDSKASNGVSAQVIVPVATVDREQEPIVTRKELWSYYCTSLYDPLSCEKIEPLSSVLWW